MNLIQLFPTILCFLVATEVVELVTLSTESSKEVIGKMLPHGKSDWCAFPFHCRNHLWMSSCFVAVHIFLFYLVCAHPVSLGSQDMWHIVLVSAIWLCKFSDWFILTWNANFYLHFTLIITQSRYAYPITLMIGYVSYHFFYHYKISSHAFQGISVLSFSH